MSVPVTVPAPAPDRMLHPVVTPEGVELRFRLASLGDRLGAFLIDVALMFLALLVIFFLFALLSSDGANGWLVALLYLGVFLVTCFYFIWFESRGGATPGKRALGLRVMDGHGDVLGVDAVVARNVMRQLEFWVPLQLLLVPASVWPSAPMLLRILACGWIFVVAGLPLFNRRRLRAGDFVAGTVVVLAPRAVLLPDLTRERPGARTAAPAARFTDAQLDVYGTYELQVLEEVLRRPAETADDRATQEAVAERIADKIRAVLPSGFRERRRFLDDFYAALRGRLEARLLLGRRKKDKHSRETRD